MVEESEIEEWLDQMKQMIRNDRFKIEMNQNRVGNIKLFQEYLINEENVKSILLNLTVNDFCEKFKMNTLDLDMNGYTFSEKKFHY